MKFNYKARTQKGEIQEGVIEASSKKSALYILEKYGFYVTDLREIGSRGFLGKKISILGISMKDLAIFTRQFAVMLRSAIPPVEALRAQVVQTNNGELKSKILKMAEVVEGGGSLSYAFSLFPNVFKPFYVSVVKSGEATGRMADSLAYLAKHLEREHNFNQKIKSAMIYPIFVIIVFIGVFFLATFFIMPKLMTIMDSFSKELPWATRMMMSMSENTRKGGWIIVLLGLFGITLLPKYLKNNEKTRLYYDKFILKLPILGIFQKKINLTKFAENLSVLISSGLPITQALKIVSDIVNNSAYQDIILECETEVSKGEKISSVLSKYPKYIPQFVYQMVATGEDTGRLDDTLMDIVKFYRDDVERTTDNLSTILEPVLIIVLALGVGVLAVAVFIPLFQIGMGGMAI